MKYFIAIPVFLLAAAGIYSLPAEQQIAEPLALYLNPARKSYGASTTKRGGSSKRVYVIETKKWISERSVNSLLHSAKGLDGVIFYNWKKIRDVTASAPGMDDRHHLVNSYLVGYRPFPTNNIFVPWQTLAQKKRYQLDHVFSKGKEEVWQDSRQAYIYNRGDCEDHAIALADWLIDMGHDARVVIGTYKGSGHAWVVLLKNNRTFLLEATRKKRLNRMRSFPLAKLQTGYQPEYMFNRTQFWKNTGSVHTANYSSSAWVKKSKYRRSS